MIRSCPKCDTSQVDARKTKTPTYRCVNGHTFDEPHEREPYVQKATKEELLEEIRRLAASLDRYPPTKMNMDEYGEHYARTYQLRFGSWSKAVEEAGYEPREKLKLKERPAECRLCDVPQSGLDFHHWRYGENEMGCYLCRECHDKVHEGSADRSNVDWLEHSVRKLVHIHLQNGGESNLDKIKSHYSLPDIEILVEEAIETYSDESSK